MAPVVARWKQPPQQMCAGYFWFCGTPLLPAGDTKHQQGKEKRLELPFPFPPGPLEE